MEDLRKSSVKIDRLSVDGFAEHILRIVGATKRLKIAEELDTNGGASEGHERMAGGEEARVLVKEDSDGVAVG